MILKSLQDIVNQSTGDKAHYPLKFPPKWENDNLPLLEDIVIWEELHYEAELIGIYAAWSPYADCYLIAYNQFCNSHWHFEFFVGEHAVQQVYDRAVSLGISLNYN